MEYYKRGIRDNMDSTTFRALALPVYVDRNNSHDTYYAYLLDFTGLFVLTLSKSKAMPPNSTGVNIPALEAYLKDRGRNALWTSDLIEEATKLHQEVLVFNDLRKMSHDRAAIPFGANNTYNARDLTGNIQALPIPDIDNDQHLVLCFKGFVEISKAFGFGDILIGNPQKRLVYEVKAMSVPSHERTQNCIRESELWGFWRKSWGTGEWLWKNKVFDHWVSAGQVVWGWRGVHSVLPERLKMKKEQAAIAKKVADRLVELIHKHESTLLSVDRVVCIGLGALDVEKPRSFVQHLAAHTAAETMRSMRQKLGVDTPIEIIAQDPAYCDQCIEVLRSELGVRATRTYDAFSKVDKNAFVITFAPTGPICGIIADLTLESGGPAAMLCDEIVQDYLRPQNEEAKYIDNEPTKNLVEYTRRCSVDYFGDAQECMGMSYEEFLERFPLEPAQLPKDTDPQARRLCVDAYARKSRSCFFDGYLYVRKS